MKRACIFFAEGFEEIEGLTVVDILRRAGVTVDMVSVTGEKRTVGSHNIPIETDRLFEEVDFNEVDLIILPGGMPGTKNLQEHKGLCTVLTKFAQEQKHIAAICAAPSVLGRLNILAGKKATCYPGFEEQLTGAKVMSDKVVQDGNIVTGKGAGAAAEFSYAILQYYMDQDEIDHLRKAMVFN